MRRLAALLVLVLFSAGLAQASEEMAETKIVEDFGRQAEGSFPEGWKARHSGAEEVYRVSRQENEAFLAARSKGEAVAIAKEFKYRLQDYPYLSWEWRVLCLPQGAEESKKELADSAAGVYVIFEGWVSPNTLKYVWSSSLPQGQTTESPYAATTKIIVLESGPEKKGEWVAEKVNVLEDYRRLFGQEPGQVQAIGLMSDSDNTRSIAEADYRRLQVSRQ